MINNRPATGTIFVDISTGNRIIKQMNKDINQIKMEIFACHYLRGWSAFWSDRVPAATLVCELLHYFFL